MQIKNQTFTDRTGNISFDLLKTCISLLENVGGEGEIDQPRRQITLAKSLESMTDELTLTPEDATLLRSLIVRSNLPPVIKVPMHDSLDPGKSGE